MLDEHQIDIEPREFAFLNAERRQAKGFALGHKDGARMRLEGQHSDRFAGGMGPVARRGDQSRMTAMDPIEIAQGQYHAARMIRVGAGMSDDAEHG